MATVPHSAGLEVRTARVGSVKAVIYARVGHVRGIVGQVDGIAISRRRGIVISARQGAALFARLIGRLFVRSLEFLSYSDLVRFLSDAHFGFDGIVG